MHDKVLEKKENRKQEKERQEKGRLKEREKEQDSYGEGNLNIADEGT